VLLATSLLVFFFFFQIRVGFAQGNFNADNCLIGGRTMDYGAFSFWRCYAVGWRLLDLSFFRIRTLLRTSLTFSPSP